MIHHTHRDTGLSHLTADKLVSQVYTLATAKAKYPNLFGWLHHKALPDSWAMELYCGEATLHELFWRGEGSFGSPAPAHSNGIMLGDGRFLITRPVPLARGRYEGESSRFFDRSGAHSFGGTSIVMDHAGWKDPTCRLLFRTSNWGIDSGHGAWAHHVHISHMHFSGNGGASPWMPTDDVEDAGIGLWDAGEVSTVEHCYFSGFRKDGITMVRGTPVRIANCSFFQLGRFGVGIIGGGKLDAYHLSGDEQGLALVGSRPGYGRPGSSNIGIFGGKQETGTSGEFRPWKGSALLDLEDWFEVEVHSLTYAATWITPYALAVVKPGVNRSKMSFHNVSFFQNVPRCLVYDRKTGKEHRFPTNNSAWFHDLVQWHWHEQHGIKSLYPVEIKEAINTKGGKLQFVGEGGATSWETAQVFDPTGGASPPVPDPTPEPPMPEPEPPVPEPEPEPEPPAPEPEPTDPTVVAEFDFASGPTSNIPAVVGDPLSQPTSWMRATMVSGGRLSNNTTSMSYPTEWKGVTRAHIKGLVWAGGGYRLLFGIVDSDGQGRGIMVLPNGAVIDNRLAAGDRVIAAPGTVQAGKSVDLDVSFDPMDVYFFGGKALTGQSWTGSMDAITLYA